MVAPRSSDVLPPFPGPGRDSGVDVGVRKALVSPVTWVNGFDHTVGTLTGEGHFTPATGPCAPQGRRIGPGPARP